MPFALSVLALRLILQLWAYARALKQGGNSPVGVPLVESPADIAAKEAASVMGNDDEVPK